MPYQRSNLFIKPANKIIGESLYPGRRLKRKNDQSKNRLQKEKIKLLHCATLGTPATSSNLPKETKTVVKKTFVRLQRLMLTSAMSHKSHKFQK